jgi:tetratricopeptide (TPR) repeat protein
MAQMHMLASEYDDCLAWGERALALADPLRADDVRVHVLNTLGTVHVMTGDPLRGLSMLHESLQRALELNLMHDSLRGYINLVESLITVGQYAEALEQLEAMIAFATGTYARGFALTAHTRQAEVLWLTGYWRRAGKILSDQVEGSDLAGGVTGLWARTLRGRMLNDTGLVEQARDLLAELLPTVMATGEIQTIAPHLGQLARSHGLLCQAAGLEAAARELMAVVDQNPYLERDTTAALLSACRAAFLCPIDPSLVTAESWLPRLERARQQLRSPEADASWMEAAGVLALMSGDPGRSLEPLQAATAAWDSLGRPYDSARASVDLGRALAASGQALQAAACLDRALATLGHLEEELSDETTRAAFQRSHLVEHARRWRAGLPSTA